MPHDPNTGARLTCFDAILFALNQTTSARVHRIADIMWAAGHNYALPTIRRDLTFGVRAGRIHRRGAGWYSVEKPPKHVPLDVFALIYLLDHGQDALNGDSLKAEYFKACGKKVTYQHAFDTLRRLTDEGFLSGGGRTRNKFFWILTAKGRERALKERMLS